METSSPEFFNLADPRIQQGPADPAKHRDKRARAAERRNADNTGNSEYVLAAPAT